MHPDSNSKTTFRIRLIPCLDSPHSFHFDAITRDLSELGTRLQIGRYTDTYGLSSSEINALGTDKLVFKSKVISRKHAQIWVGDGGKFFIKDTKSSGGTFLNNERLGLANEESAPFQLTDGDILQLGVDYQGGTDDFCKSVKIRVVLPTVGEVGASKYVVHIFPLHVLMASLSVTVEEYDPSLSTRRSASSTFPASDESLPYDSPDETIDVTPDPQQQNHEPP